MRPKSGYVKIPSTFSVTRMCVLILQERRFRYLIERLRYDIFLASWQELLACVKGNLVIPKVKVTLVRTGHLEFYTGHLHG